VDLESEDVKEGPKKHHRATVNEELFPWKGTSAVLRARLEPEVQQCLDLLEDWAADPTLVVRKILLSPGCPDFPPDQWLNIVKGYAVDLAKVLGVHYSFDVEAKQSQDVRDLFHPFKSPSSPKPSQAMGTGLSHSERPSKRSHMPCQDDTLSMPLIKHTCQGFLPPSLPHSTLGSSTLTRPSDSEQPIRNTFASLSLPSSTTSEPFSSPHLVCVQVPEKESKGPPSVVQELPFLEAERPATTGIEAPVIAQHLNAHTRMSAITVGAEELTDNQTIRSRSLNQGLSRGQKFRRHFVWTPATAVRSWTVC
jgi:hypothetical protein